MKVFLISPGLSAGGAEKNLLTVNYQKMRIFIVLTDSFVAQDETVNDTVKLIIFKNNKNAKNIKNLANLINDEKPDCLISTIVNGKLVTSCAKLIARSKSTHILRMSTKH